ncbi:MAG: O-antigen ligase family protein [Pyrinomonadaceae bacterium]
MQSSTEDKLRVEQWLYCLFVFTLPFATPFNFLGAPLQSSDVMFLVTAVFWFISFAARRTKLRWSWFYLCLAAYAVAVTLSTITSIDPTRSSVKLAGKFYLIAVAFLTFNIISSIGVFKRVMQAWLLGASVVLFCSLLGIVLFYSGLRDAAQNIVVHPIFGSLPTGNYPRIEGFFSYPSILCNFLGVTWMLTLALWSNGWLRERVFWLFGIALFIVDAFTLTPGLGGIFLATGYFLREKIKSNFGRLAFGSGLGIAAAFLLAACVTLFAYDSSGTRIPLLDGEISISHRAQSWQTGFETFLQEPILGRGVGMPIANALYTDPSGNTQLLTDAHNTYISVLGETGLLGFLTFISLVCCVTFSLLRWKPENDSYKTIRLCLLLAMLDAFFYQSLTGSYEDTRHLWVLFGIIAAIKLMHNAECTVHT